jgi:hypothetical protein
MLLLLLTRCLRTLPAIAAGLADIFKCTIAVLHPLLCLLLLLLLLLLLPFCQSTRHPRATVCEGLTSRTLFDAATR